MRRREHSRPRQAHPHDHLGGPPRHHRSSRQPQRPGVHARAGLWPAAHSTDGRAHGLHRRPRRRGRRDLLGPARRAPPQPHGRRARRHGSHPPGHRHRLRRPHHTARGYRDTPRSSSTSTSCAASAPTRAWCAAKAASSTADAPSRPPTPSSTPTTTTSCSHTAPPRASSRPGPDPTHPGVIEPVKPDARRLESASASIAHPDAATGLARGRTPDDRTRATERDRRRTPATCLTGRCTARKRIRLRHGSIAVWS